MKNKKGFTLVELLAVIVVLGIVSTIAVTSITGIRRKAADDTFKELEHQIAKLGPAIYSHEVIVRDDSSTFYSEYKRCKKEDCDFIVPLGDESSSGTLIGSGYLKEIQSPYNSSETCEGYLYVDPASTDEVYKGYLKCGDKYTDDNEEEYDKNALLEQVNISDIK